MIDNIVRPGFSTAVDLSPEHVLQGVLELAGQLQTVVVVAAGNDGKLHTYSTTADLSLAHWLLAIASADMLKRAGDRPLEPKKPETPPDNVHELR